MTDTNNPKFIYKKQTIYEFTINPNDEFQYERYQDRIIRTTNNIKKILEDTKTKYNLRLEISMPQYGDKHINTIARIHYHGIIMFPTNRNIISWLLHTHTRLTKIGRIQLNPYRPEYWDQYIKKQKYLFKGTYNYKLKTTSIKYIKKMIATEK